MAPCNSPVRCLVIMIINISLIPNMAIQACFPIEDNKWFLNSTFCNIQGLVRESRTDWYVLVEESGGAGRRGHLIQSELCHQDDEAESIMASAHDQRQEELQVILEKSTKGFLEWSLEKYGINNALKLLHWTYHFNCCIFNSPFK